MGMMFFPRRAVGEMDERLLDEPASAISSAAWNGYGGFFLFREYPLSWMRIAFILLACEWALTSLAQHLFIAGLVLLAIYMLFKAGGLLMAASIQEHEERPPGIGQMFLILEGKVFEFILLLILLFFAAAAWGYLLYGIAGALGLWNPLSGMADIFMFLLWFLTVQQLLGFAPVLVFIQDENADGRHYPKRQSQLQKHPAADFVRHHAGIADGGGILAAWSAARQHSGQGGYLYFVAAGFLAEQARLHDFGVVEHQYVAPTHKLRQDGKHFVAQGFAGQRRQQPACAAFGGRLLGNQVFGKVEIEIGKLHEMEAV